MKTIINNKNGVLYIIVCLLLTLIAIIEFSLIDASTAYATDDWISQDTLGIENAARAIFGDKKMRSIENLYNYDDSADYIYIDFDD